MNHIMILESIQKNLHKFSKSHKQQIIKRIVVPKKAAELHYMKLSTNSYKPQDNQEEVQIKIFHSTLQIKIVLAKQMIKVLIYILLVILIFTVANLIYLSNRICANKICQHSIFKLCKLE
ncbi:transmembrane protein, putative (macronuclear) [Tetrahymena thermophila SB210]|uniref:Transmembrane protein, putative n=1 Tax=Tetrahymena thermophila (strain SB210) TaxID=312017 RepID=W7XG28_TETTS|nr:transmembrane protein, putative [Tetrahymena thermophila SB210]EWS73036.1 transmembrane protein, putative [Tetrahymena thermophila SB210]|eukprot:XP_012654433.1 transmembrane protein, putative [Tetrahymena thermophila SB210]